MAETTPKPGESVTEYQERQNADAQMLLGNLYRDALGDTPAERREVYRELAVEMINGIPLSPEEIRILVYGINFEEDKAKPVELDSLTSQLARQEVMNPGSTQVEMLTSGIEQTNFFPDVDASGNYKERIFFPFGFRSKGTAAAGAGIPGMGLAKGLMQGAKAHPWRTMGGLSVGGGLLAYSMGEGSDSDTYGIDEQPMGDSEFEGGAISSRDFENLTDAEIDELYALGNIMVIDAVTGAEIPLAKYDASQLFKNAPGGGGYSDSGGTYSPALIEKAQALGVSPEELARLQVDGDDAGFGTVNPMMFGEINLPYSQFPYGAAIHAQPEVSYPRGTGDSSRVTVPGRVSGEAFRTPQTRTHIPPELAKFMPPEDVADINMERVLPPGAQINPRAFDRYGDKTYIQIISETAEIYDIPVELLYGQINAQSGFVANMETPDGSRAGLAQIDRERYPYLSDAQVYNPLFAIRWSGRELRTNANKYGSWEGALASQVDPAEAEFLKKNGQFSNPYARAFVEDTMTYAANSGMGRYLFDPDNIPTTRPRGYGGGGGGGVKLPAYQAPDPNTLIQIARATYQEMLGRTPTPEEEVKSTARLNELFKEKYNSDIAKIQGKSSIGVDPQASYEEGIRELGEFGFREDTRDTKDMMDFMGQIVGIMQGV